MKCSFFNILVEPQCNQNNESNLLDFEIQDIECSTADHQSIYRNTISPIDDSDADPTVTCEVGECRDEVFAACPRCEILLCFIHWNEDFGDCFHGRGSNLLPRNLSLTESLDKTVPESFNMDGEEREGNPKVKKQNKQKIAKELRNQGTRGNN